MLVLSRKRNEQTVINGDITFTVVEVRGHRVRLGSSCPLHAHGMAEEGDWLDRPGVR